MSDEYKCPFCGSTEVRKPTPYVDRMTGEVITTTCCAAQSKNKKYIDKKYGRSNLNKPDLEVTWES